MPLLSFLSPWRATLQPRKYRTSRLHLACVVGLGGLLGLTSVAGAGAPQPCSTNSRILDNLIPRPAMAQRVCSGSTFSAYQREVKRYQSLGVHFEIWRTALKDAPAFNSYLRSKLNGQAYRLKQTYTNGESKYAHPGGRGVRVSSWKTGATQYWMLFIY